MQFTKSEQQYSHYCGNGLDLTLSICGYGTWLSRIVFPLKIVSIYQLKWLYAACTWKLERLFPVPKGCCRVTVITYVAVQFLVKKAGTGQFVFS